MVGGRRIPVLPGRSAAPCPPEIAPSSDVEPRPPLSTSRTHCVEQVGRANLVRRIVSIGPPIGTVASAQPRPSGGAPCQLRTLSQLLQRHFIAGKHLDEGKRGAEITIGAQGSGHTFSSVDVRSLSEDRGQRSDAGEAGKQSYGESQRLQIAPNVVT